jgi:hypothetical protein
MTPDRQASELVRPLLDDPRRSRVQQQVLPAPRGLPVAVVGIGSAGVTITSCGILRASAMVAIHINSMQQRGARRRPRCRSPLTWRTVAPRTLALLEAYVAALGESPARALLASAQSAPVGSGHVGWFQDWWIARNRQRDRGLPANRTIRPAAGAPGGCRCPVQLQPGGPRPAAGTCPADLAATRAYLAASLEETLALLAAATGKRRGLYFYRLALFHEDMHAEAAIYMAQALDIPLPDICRCREPARLR